MDPRIAPLAEMLRLNTRLAHNCLDALSDEQARSRPASTANSAAYVAAHLVESRYYILQGLGGSDLCPFTDRVGWKSIDDITEWPNLKEIRAAWDVVSATLDQRLAKLTPAELDKAIETQFPLETKSTLGLLGFLVSHDSYHVGQLSLLRKAAGLPAMSYT